MFFKKHSPDFKNQCISILYKNENISNQDRLLISIIENMDKSLFDENSTELCREIVSIPNSPNSFDSDLPLQVIGNQLCLMQTTHKFSLFSGVSLDKLGDNFIVFCDSEKFYRRWISHFLLKRCDEDHNYFLLKRDMHTDSEFLAFETKILCGMAKLNSFPKIFDFVKFDVYKDFNYRTVHMASGGLSGNWPDILWYIRRNIPIIPIIMSSYDDANIINGDIGVVCHPVSKRTYMPYLKD